MFHFVSGMGGGKTDNSILKETRGDETQMTSGCAKLVNGIVGNGIQDQTARETVVAGVGATWHSRALIWRMGSKIKLDGGEDVR